MEQNTMDELTDYITNTEVIQDAFKANLEGMTRLGFAFPKIHNIWQSTNEHRCDFVEVMVNCEVATNKQGKLIYGVVPNRLVATKYRFAIMLHDKVSGLVWEAKGI